MKSESPHEALAAHPFRFLWSSPVPVTVHEAVAAISFIERRAADLILESEPEPVSDSAVARILMPYHQEGTFSIGVRRAAVLPPFIRGESGDFTTWATTVTRSDLVRMLYSQALPPHVSSTHFKDIASIVAAALQFTGSTGRLCDLIPNQNYIDYIRRAIGLYAFHNPDVEFHTEGDYNELAIDVALSIIKDYLPFDSNGPPTLETLRTLMIYSLLAGVVCLDMKCSHCAASSLTPDNAAACGDDSERTRVSRIARWLSRKASDDTLICPELFAWDAYERIVLSRPCSLCFFPDDLGETVFDLYRLQSEMAYNSGLRVIFAPRNGRFHNDCAIADIDPLLELDCFALLRALRDQGRFLVSTHGPRSGAVDLRRLNRRLADVILDGVDVLFVKGSRSYEMNATGVRIPTFAGQAVAREFSESVIGASASSGVPVLRFVHAFPDYWGFTERHRRTEPLFPDARLGWQASMTAMDSARFTASRRFRQACRKRPIEELSVDIVARAQELKIAPHQVSLSSH